MTVESYRIRSRWPRRLAIGAGLILVGAGGLWPWMRGSAEIEGVSAQIDEIVEEVMDREAIAGLAVGVARGGRVIHAAGYGYADVENRLETTSETVFSVGSITKQFTATSILKLVDEGRLALDDPIAEHLPFGPGFAPGVTVHSLMNHTSGIKNYTTMEKWWRTIGVEMRPDEMAAVFTEEPLDFRPGTRFSYSNSGYFLLGMIIEGAGGQPFGGHLNESLAVPLGLEATSYCDDRALIPNRARGYQVLGGKLFHSPYVSMSQAFSAGGICSNVVDMMQWTRFLSEGAVLGRDTYDLMVTPTRLLDGTTIEYGYGFAVGYLDGHRRISHVGGTLGFSSFMAHYPDDDLRVVVLSNTEGTRTASIESEIARLVLGLDERSSRDIRLSADELRVYTGTYDISLAEVTVSAEKDRLVAELTVPGLEGRYVLLFQGDDTFEVESDPETYARFEVRDGVAEGFVLVHQGITMRGWRVAPAP